jgi:hypothetical protein
MGNLKRLNISVGSLPLLMCVVESRHDHIRRRFQTQRSTSFCTGCDILLVHLRRFKVIRLVSHGRKPCVPVSVGLRGGYLWRASRCASKVAALNLHINCTPPVALPPRSERDRSARSTPYSGIITHIGPHDLLRRV